MQIVSTQSYKSPERRRILEASRLYKRHDEKLSPRNFVGLMFDVQIERMKQPLVTHK